MSKIHDVCTINRECFTSDDAYSNVRFTQPYNLITVSDNGTIVGFIIYTEFDTHIESLRRGVTKKARGKGYGVKLTKKLIAVANRTGKEIYTYVAKSNLPSLNSNIKCGYRIENIGEDWVYIRYRPKK